MNSKWQPDIERINSWRATGLRLLSEEPSSKEKAEWQEKARKNIEDSAELDGELQAAGVPFDVGELSNLSVPYPEALPVLLRHLKISHRPDIQKCIIDALAVPYAGEEAFAELVRLLERDYDRLDDDGLFTLGIAISKTSGKKQVSILQDIARNRNYTKARLRPLLKLAKLRDPVAESVVAEMLRTGDYLHFAIEAARAGKMWALKPTIEPLASHSHVGVRSQARQYLKAFERQSKSS